MNETMPAPAIADDGLDARIQGSPFTVLSLIEIRNRLSAANEMADVTPEALGRAMDLSLPQVHAALAYYHANQTLFDAELVRRREAVAQALAQIYRQNGRPWADIMGSWPGDETDQEIAEALERMS